VFPKVLCCPFLFLVYINDIVNDINNDIRLFADGPWKHHKKQILHPFPYPYY
jgi:hypothetical protein